MLPWAGPHQAGIKNSWMYVQYWSEQLPDVGQINAPLPPAILRAADLQMNPAVPPAVEGIQSYLWGSRFGAMLIEVKDGVAYVNGQRVEPSTAATLDRE